MRAGHNVPRDLLLSNMYKQGPCVLTCPKLRTTYTRGFSALYPQFFPFTEAYVSLYLFTHITLLYVAKKNNYNG